jgi:hypothetical protein
MLNRGRRWHATGRRTTHRGGGGKGGMIAVGSSTASVDTLISMHMQGKTRPKTRGGSVVKKDIQRQKKSSFYFPGVRLWGEICI